MTILFQAKFLALVILFSSISSLVKSETPSHCSELYGCQVDDPQEDVVNSNLSNETQKLISITIKKCKQWYQSNVLTFLPKSGLWIQNQSSQTDESVDLELVEKQKKIIGWSGRYWVCPREFNNYINIKAKNKFKAEKARQNCGEYPPQFCYYNECLDQEISQQTASLCNQLVGKTLYGYNKIEKFRWKKGTVEGLTYKNIGDSLSPLNDPDPSYIAKESGLYIIYIGTDTRQQRLTSINGDDVIKHTYE